LGKFIDTQGISIAPGIREAASQDGAVLLDIEQGICFSLNPVGLKIWELLKKDYSFDRIVDTLADDFEVSRSQLVSDIMEFVCALEAKHLIRRPGQSTVKQSWLKSLVFPWRKERIQF
jgi:hypothetical protein